MSEPVQNQLYTFQSYHLSDKFILRNLENIFQQVPVSTDLTRAAFKNRNADGYFFIFNFGTICFFNTSKEEQKQITDLLATKYPMLQHGKEWDDFTLEIAPGKRQQVHVGFNKVTLNAVTFERADVIALLLAESVTLDFYESLADDLLEKSFVTAEVLNKTGRLPGSIRDINRSIGLSMSTKQLIVSNLYLLDKPDVLWDDEILEKLYRGLFRNFEVRERFMAIEFKLKTLQDNMALIGSLINNRKAEHLEVTIIILILIEIALFGYEIFIRTHG
jgi:uncharacterized Rmd1/YagE family protein